MYKLSDAAIKLNIEKVYLFELLMTRGEVLNDHVIKEYGVTYITDRGMSIIEDIINGREIQDYIVDMKVSSDHINNGEISSGTDSNVSLDDNDAIIGGISEKIELDQSFDLKYNDSIDNEQSHLIDYDDKLKGHDDKDLEVDYTIIKEKTRLSFYERETKKKKIVELRSKLIELDSEIKRKSEAIESYDKILEEDIQWICILEDKLGKKLEHYDDETQKESSQRNLLDKLFMKK